MTQVKHTPGPWKWHYEDGSQWFLEPGILVVEGGMTDGTPDGDAMDRANARLIAAAPDMLESLRYADNEFARLGLPADCSPRLEVRAAIAKAEGRA